MINLGKPGTKAYRLYYLATKKVLFSRDVCFDEDKSWPWSQEINEADVPLETFTVVSYDVTEPREMLLVERDIPESDEERAEAFESGNTDWDADSKQRRFRSLRDIYANTEELEIDDE